MRIRVAKLDTDREPEEGRRLVNEGALLSFVNQLPSSAI